MTEPLPTVFVADDDAAVRKSLARLLKSAGCHTESFASADEFLERWEADPVPGRVLLDILMPGLDSRPTRHRTKVLFSNLRHA